MNNVTVDDMPFRKRASKPKVKERASYGRESQFQKDVLDYLETIGAVAFKVSRANINGVSDIIACYNGTFVAIEVKLPYNHATDLQEWFLSNVESSGGVGMVLYPDTNWIEIINRKLGGIK